MENKLTRQRQRNPSPTGENRQDRSPPPPPPLVTTSASSYPGARPTTNANAQFSPGESSITAGNLVAWAVDTTYEALAAPSPLYNKNRKRLSPANAAIITDTTMPPAAIVTKRTENEAKQQSVDGRVSRVQPPKTPLGSSTYAAPSNDGGISATQRVRIELSAHAGSRPLLRANSSENVFVSGPPGYDEERDGPQSCPSTLDNGGVKQPRFKFTRRRQMRANELVTAKLLPSVESNVNSLMGYVRELQMSEATLRKTKQHTEEELTQSLSKVTKLEKTMHEVERDRELARRKLEEQERLIQDLAAKLKQAEGVQSDTPANFSMLPSIAEEATSNTTTNEAAVERQRPMQKSEAPDHSPEPLAVPHINPDGLQDSTRSDRFGIASPLSPNRPLWDPWASGGATPMKNLPPVFTIGAAELDSVSSGAASIADLTSCSTEANPHTQLETAPKLNHQRQAPTKKLEANRLLPKHLVVPPTHPDEYQGSTHSNRFELMSPRSPNRPLWDPWASGGATPMKNLPPVFSIGSTGLDPVIIPSIPITQESTTESLSSAAEDYELKSVLMSPRRTQVLTQTAEGSASDKHQINDQSEPQYPAPAFDLGATPPSPQKVGPPGMQDGCCSTQTQDETSLRKVSSQMTPKSPGKAPAIKNMYQQQYLDPPLRDNDIAQSSDAAEWSGVQNSHEILVPPPTVAMAEEAVPPQDAVPQPKAYPEGAEATKDVSGPLQPQNVVAEHDIASGPSMGVPPPPPAAAYASETVGADNHPPRPASPPLKQSKATTIKPASTEPVSLETLLVEFFTEVDKKRLKMAKVYGKRYAGREKWLFAELTKRYGASKVSELKARYERGSSADASSSNSNGNQATRPGDVSEHAKAPRQGHPRHPQFFHPPAPANGVGLSGDAPPADAAAAPAPTQDSEGAAVSEVTERAASAGVPTAGQAAKNTSGRVARVSPRSRRSGGNIDAFSGPPSPSFPLPQECGDRNEDVPSEGARAESPPTFPPSTNGPPPMNGLPVNGPPPMMQREEADLQTNQAPFAPPRGFEPNTATPAGLRQRRNVGGPGAQGRQQSEAPPVTLEGLLKELYKKHQPDKLKNVSIVAKQYAGKERELVGLLKGKYGALSVKRLEENLEALEHAHRARMGGKGAGKKRGRFVRTLSLVFWLSVLLFFAFGAVFVSFVVLDAQECHALVSDEEELESAEDCTPLKRELQTFTYERVGAYVRQSHHEACFCSEWKARESALLSNLSGDDLVELARLLPFSPDAFGEPWIATVKEQVPSQEFYESYAKPVVDLSLDAGSFVWSYVLELTGFEDGPAKNVKSEPVVVEDNESEIVPLDLEHERGVEIESEARIEERELEQAVEEAVNDSFYGDVETDEHAAIESGVEVDVEAEAFDGAAVDANVDASVGVSVDEESNDISVDVEVQAELDASAETDVAVADVEVVTDNLVVLSEEDAKQYSIDTPEENNNAEQHDANALGEMPEVESADEVISESELEAEKAAEESVVSTEVDAEEVPSDGILVSELNEAPGSVVDVEDDLAAPVEIEDDKAPSEDDSLDTTVEESEPAVGISEETADIATTIDLNEEESDDVVEVEVRQESLDLSYPEVDVEASEESQDVVASADVASDAADEEPKSAVSEAEVDEDAEHENDSQVDSTVSIDADSESAEPKDRSDAMVDENAASPYEEDVLASVSELGTEEIASEDVDVGGVDEVVEGSAVEASEAEAAVSVETGADESLVDSADEENTSGKEEAVVTDYDADDTVCTEAESNDVTEDNAVRGDSEESDVDEAGVDATAAEAVVGEPLSEDATLIDEEPVTEPNEESAVDRNEADESVAAEVEVEGLASDSEIESNEETADEEADDAAEMETEGLATENVCTDESTVVSSEEREGTVPYLPGDDGTSDLRGGSAGGDGAESAASDDGTFFTLFEEMSNEESEGIAVGVDKNSTTSFAEIESAQLPSVPHVLELDEEATVDFRETEPAESFETQVEKSLTDEVHVTMVDGAGVISDDVEVVVSHEIDLENSQGDYVGATDDEPVGNNGDIEAAELSTREEDSIDVTSVSGRTGELGLGSNQGEDIVFDEAVAGLKVEDASASDNKLSSEEATEVLSSAGEADNDVHEEEVASVLKDSESLPSDIEDGFRSEYDVKEDAFENGIASAENEVEEAVASDKTEESAAVKVHAEKETELENSDASATEENTSEVELATSSEEGVEEYVSVGKEDVRSEEEEDDLDGASEESVAIEATKVSDDVDETAAESTEELSEQLDQAAKESADVLETGAVGAPVADAEGVAMAERHTEVQTEDLSIEDGDIVIMDITTDEAAAAGRETSSQDRVAERGPVDSPESDIAFDTDAEADEEIAFMEELEDLDEVLRMAERAAAATLDAQ